LLKTFDEVSKMITDGGLLHIAGSEELLRKLPKGKWIGGSTEYFIDENGGIVSDELVFVTEFPYETFIAKTYDITTINNVASDAFEYGYSILIIPFDSDIHKTYAENAADYTGMFVNRIVGWISGVNLKKPGQVPIVVNGVTGEVYTDRGVALHLDVPGKKDIQINIVNIFEQDESSPTIKFMKTGFSVDKCLINGKETVFSKYIEENKIDTKLPFVGDYSGIGVNISIKSIDNGIVNLYAPVFEHIEYKFAKDIPDYATVLGSLIEKTENTDVLCSYTCILNFLYGDLEGKKIKSFTGPVTFGEIAYQLINQTLVYVTIQ